MDGAQIKGQASAAQRDLLERYFVALADKDVDAAVACFTPHASFRLGDGEPVVGHEALRASTAHGLAQLRRVEHRLVGAWEVDGVLVSEVVNTYTRHDGVSVVVPAAAVHELEGGLWSAMRAYLDMAPVFAA